ncbi:MAG TPA: hypothetical protein VFZ61_13745, partial [Polyangiales bacterium]
MAVPSDRFALESALARSTLSLEQAARRLCGKERLDFTGLPGGSLSLLLTEAARKGAPPMLVITADQDTAFACAEDLRFFGVSAAPGEDALPVLRFPTPDTTPFLQVAADRKSSMERVAALCHLAHGLPWQFLVAPVSALLRKVAPRASMAERSRRIQPTDVVDRDELLALFADCGYLRVPVVEDPGSFAARGSLIDVYPPHAEGPVRIELDDELVASIKQFDPDTQRALKTLDHVFVHPARQTLWDDQTKQRVRERISDLCDSFNLPSRKRNELLDELSSGRNVLGVDALLPAFYERLETLFEYLPGDLRCVIVDPTRVAQTASDELERAHRDRAARLEDAPAYPVDTLYISGHALRDTLERHPALSVHELAVAGASGESDLPLSVFEAQRLEDTANLGGEDHSALLSRLRQQRKETGRSHALTPLADSLKGFLETGLRVLVTTRTRTQADRIRGLLKSYGVPVANETREFTPEQLRAPIPGKVEAVVGSLSRGFVLGAAALACVTEGEIFGERSA